MQPLVDDNLFNAIEEGMRHHQSFGHDMNNISGRFLWTSHFINNLLISRTREFLMNFLQYISGRL